jgi:probable rRNA maturation factor
MNLTAKPVLNAVIYVENLYEGDLNLESVKAVDSIPWTDWFQTWLKSLRSDIAADGYEISLRLTGDRQMQALNSEYRFLDQPTDVLAFAATEDQMPLPADINEPLYLGDIIVSLDTSARQATEQNHSLIVELAWLTSHGLLHLLGWDHPDEASLAQMLKQQSNLLELIEIK